MIKKILAQQFPKDINTIKKLLKTDSPNLNRNSLIQVLIKLFFKHNYRPSQEPTESLSDPDFMPSTVFIPTSNREAKNFPMCVKASPSPSPKRSSPTCASLIEDEAQTIAASGALTSNLVHHQTSKTPEPFISFLQQQSLRIPGAFTNISLSENYNNQSVKLALTAAIMQLSSTKTASTNIDPSATSQANKQTVDKIIIILNSIFEDDKEFWNSTHVKKNLLDILCTDQAITTMRPLWGNLHCAELDMWYYQLKNNPLLKKDLDEWLDLITTQPNFENTIDQINKFFEHVPLPGNYNIESIVSDRFNDIEKKLGPENAKSLIIKLIKLIQWSKLQEIKNPEFKIQKINRQAFKQKNIALDEHENCEKCKDHWQIISTIQKQINQLRLSLHETYSPQKKRKTSPHSPEEAKLYVSAKKVNSERRQTPQSEISRVLEL